VARVIGADVSEAVDLCPVRHPEEVGDVADGNCTLGLVGHARRIAGRRWRMWYRRIPATSGAAAGQGVSAAATCAVSSELRTKNAFPSRNFQ
jgi:hypothetical protein